MDGILDVHNQMFKEMKNEGMEIQNLRRAAVNNEVGIKSSCSCSGDMKRRKLSAHRAWSVD